MTLRLTEEEYQRLIARRRGAQTVAKTLTGKRWEEEFAVQLDAAHLVYVREFKFLPVRKFRFDFAFLPQRVALEIDGVVHRIKGRFTSDREKGNLALLAGWRVLHVDPAQVKDGEALALLLVLLASRVSHG